MAHIGIHVCRFSRLIICYSFLKTEDYPTVSTIYWKLNLLMFCRQHKGMTLFYESHCWMDKGQTAVYVIAGTTAPPRGHWHSTTSHCTMSEIVTS